MNQLNIASSDFRQVENCWPQFRKIHCALARPNVNLCVVSWEFSALYIPMIYLPSHE